VCFTYFNQVVYVSRSHGGALNGGREVVNEDEVVHAIRSFLEQRGRGEELVEYHTLTFDSFADKAKFFATESLAIVGPHGGGLMNHRFMSRDSMVVEFMPTSFKRVAHYEDISTLGQTYGSVVVDPVEGTINDMEIDPAKVISLLDGNLGMKSDTVILDRL
jgi:capsular polysaccharide biosynthesis protein